jgi:hypothetical protein
MPCLRQHYSHLLQRMCHVFWKLCAAASGPTLRQHQPGSSAGLWHTPSSSTPGSPATAPAASMSLLLLPKELGILLLMMESCPALHMGCGASRLPHLSCCGLCTVLTASVALNPEAVPVELKVLVRWQPVDKVSLRPSLRDGRVGGFDCVGTDWHGLCTVLKSRHTAGRRCLSFRPEAKVDFNYPKSCPQSPRRSGSSSSFMRHQVKHGGWQPPCSHKRITNSGWEPCSSSHCGSIILSTLQRIASNRWLVTLHLGRSCGLPVWHRPLIISMVCDNTSSGVSFRVRT